jgi:adenylylsulfate kinase
MLIVFVFTGKIELTLLVGSFDVILKMVLYYFHERTWNKIYWGRSRVKPFVLWFTGLSGAGKSTLAEAFVKEFRKYNVTFEQLDGDVVRDVFPKTGFTKDERNMHIRRVGFLAGILERNGVPVICSFISPYRESRQFVRNNTKNFVEIHVSAPLEVCEQRDPKGLYKKVRAGEIKQFTGIDDPYEPPENPELVIDTAELSVQDCIWRIFGYLHKKGYIAPG